MTPISLSDAQMRMVREYAKTIPIEWRSRFLESISDHLTGQDVTDSAVAHAVQAVIDSMATLVGSRCNGE